MNILKVTNVGRYYGCLVIASNQDGRMCPPDGCENCSNSTDTPYFNYELEIETGVILVSAETERKAINKAKRNWCETLISSGTVHGKKPWDAISFIKNIS